MAEQARTGEDSLSPEIVAGLESGRTLGAQIMSVGDFMRTSVGLPAERLEDGSLASGGERIYIELPQGLIWENGQVVEDPAGRPEPPKPSIGKRILDKLGFIV